ncbi:MAG: nitroreductase family protein, partial [Methanolinea sp.]|jgi:nitroreductase|nr:nitroreductase family protein [Methanolinea sp.]
MNVGTTIIKSRHSVRKYKPGPVDEHVIRDALECARHAPTAMNLQPWLFGVVRDRTLLKKIAGLTDHGGFIADAAVCFAVFGEKKATYYLEDCCAATETLILSLQAYGVGSCWVAGEKKNYAEAVRKLLLVPDGYTLVSLVPAGFPAEITIQKKKELDEVAFFEAYKEE